jgi:hypothetical protein
LAVVKPSSNAVMFFIPDGARRENVRSPESREFRNVEVTIKHVFIIPATVWYMSYFLSGCSMSFGLKNQGVV